MIKLSNFQKIYFVVTVLITLYIFYLNYLYDIEIHARFISRKGIYGYIGVLVDINYLIFFYMIYHIRDKNKKYTGKYISKLPKKLINTLLIIKNLIISFLFFVAVIFFNDPGKAIGVVAYENKTPPIKKVTYSVVVNKYMTYNHFKKYYLEVAPLLNYYQGRIRVSSDCYENYKIGDTIEIRYFEKRDVLIYIDYIAIPEMTCPKIIKHKDSLNL